MGNSVRDAVRQRWGHVKYSELGGLAEDADKKRGEERLIEVVNLTSEEEEEEEEEDVAVKSIWPIKLLWSEVYDDEGDFEAGGEFLVKLEEFLGDELLEMVYLFSFQYEMDWVLSMIPGHVKVVVTAQEGTVIPASSGGGGHDVEFRMLRMPPFCSHHSKLVVAFYKNRSCRLMMPSNNFTAMESQIPQQMVWVSPILEYGGGSSAGPQSLFRNELVRYLERYPNPDYTLISRLSVIDFKPLDDTAAEFVFSAPGGGGEDLSGLPLLYQRLQITPPRIRQAACKNQHQHYFCQTSSIGSPVNYRASSDPRNLFTNLMVPLFSGSLSSLPKSARSCPGAEFIETTLRVKQIHPHILYPTVKEFTQCTPGWLCSGWFHFHYDKQPIAKMQYTMLKENNFLEKQQEYELKPGSTIALPIIKRDKVPCHTKFFFKFTSASARSWNTDDCDWALFTSANLSTHAWGKPPSYVPKNYECGVLYHSCETIKVQVVSAKDIAYSQNRSSHHRSQISTSSSSRLKTVVNIMTPFWLPTVPYSGLDQAFCASTNYVEFDQNGMHYTCHS